MVPPITEHPVVVTGANGFIASWIVKFLLERGYKVRGTVRSKSKAAHLLEFQNAATHLELVEAELLNPGAFDECMKGVEYVLHTASPYSLQVKDPQRDLVDPAVRGSLNVLEACAKAGTVKKVILTSSIAAIQDNCPPEGTEYNEEHWNTTSSLKSNPYYFSKKLAEESAWKFVEQLPADGKFELVTIHPGAVIGPSFTRTINTSVSIVNELLTGKVPAMVKLCFGNVDVRDTAMHHILALENPRAKGRYLSVDRTTTVSDYVAILKAHGYDKYPLPFNIAPPYAGVWLMSWIQPGQQGQFLRANANRMYSFANSKIKSELGAEFIDFEKSLLDTAGFLVDMGFIKDKRTSQE